MVARSATASEIPGLDQLWAQSIGDPRICVAVLDGPVDRSHASLVGARLTQLETLVSGLADGGPASRHGTHVASVIFGQHGGPVWGIAPCCRGLIIPVFSDGPEGSLAPCSQLDLARAILQAVQQRAHIINISGGEFMPSGAAHPLLADAVRYSASCGVLIVAAAGNQGCDCLHIPAALPSVLAVGAMDAQGQPLGFSNWGEPYQTQGVLALGERIVGARSGGGTVTNSGTSFATPIVSGIVALLLSLQLERGQKPNPLAVRAAILESALGCLHQPVSECRRLLAGRLDVEGATDLITRGVPNMSDPIATGDTAQPESAHNDANVRARLPDPGVKAASYGGDGPTASPAPEQPAAATVLAPPAEERSASPAMERVTPSACSCACTPGQLVYAIGELGYDFGTEARRDAIYERMPRQIPHPEFLDDRTRDESPDPHDVRHLLYHLRPQGESPIHPDSAAVIWHLNLDGTPIYAIRGDGPFGTSIYRRLHGFLDEQVRGVAERVAIAGRVVGQARLLSGQVIPVISAEYGGMWNWKISDLIASVCGNEPAEQAAKRQFHRCEAGVRAFLERVYYELRNLGVTPQDRALNYAATNAFDMAKVFAEAIRDKMELDSIGTEPSPICRPGSECWDVKLMFFDPQKVFERARRVFRFTIDVSDVVPVTVGHVRTWSVR